MATVTIKIDLSELQTMCDIIEKYQSIMMAMAKLSGSQAVQDYNTVAKTINSMLERVEP